jgi:hypothetical protein
MPAPARIVHDVDPASDSLVARAFPKVDYRDAVRAGLPKGRFMDINAFARQYFLAQPAWLRTISMNTPQRSKIVRAVEQTRFQVGDRIGSWQVHDRNEEEIVFGESLGFMQYRFSLRFRPGAEADAVEASTAVRLTGRLGLVYFAIVRLLHKRFVRQTLLNTLKYDAKRGAGR